MAQQLRSYLRILLRREPVQPSTAITVKPVYGTVYLDYLDSVPALALLNYTAFTRKVAGKRATSVLEVFDATNFFDPLFNHRIPVDGNECAPVSWDFPDEIG